MYKTAVIVAVFILGLCFVMKYNNIEGFDNKLHARCPNILIQKGSAFLLYNSKLAKVPGVNPLRFNHLDDYVEFIEWQRSQGIRCPVLYLQEAYDAQATKLAGMFAENFNLYAADATDEVKAAGPKVG